MNALGIFRLRPTEAILLAGAFRLVRPERPFALGELHDALEMAGRARFGGVLSIEPIERLGCVEVRAGAQFVREFWVDADGIRYYPHRDDSALSTWLLHQLGHRAAAELGAEIDFENAIMEPFFQNAFPSPREFVDRSPECSGLLRLPAKWIARHELSSSLNALPTTLRAWLEHADELWPDEPQRRGLILP